MNYNIFTGSSSQSTIYDPTATAFHQPNIQVCHLCDQAFAERDQFENHYYECYSGNQMMGQFSSLGLGQVGSDEPSPPQVEAASQRILSMGFNAVGEEKQEDSEMMQGNLLISNRPYRNADNGSNPNNHVMQVEENQVRQSSQEERKMEQNAINSGDYAGDLAEVQCDKCGDQVLKDFLSDHICTITCPLCSAKMDSPNMLHDHLMVHDMEDGYVPATQHNNTHHNHNSGHNHHSGSHNNRNQPRRDGWLRQQVQRRSQRPQPNYDQYQGSFGQSRLSQQFLPQRSQQDIRNARMQNLGRGNQPPINSSAGAGVVPQVSHRTGVIEESFNPGDYDIDQFEEEQEEFEEEQEYRQRGALGGLMLNSFINSANGGNQGGMFRVVFNDGNSRQQYMMGPQDFLMRSQDLGHVFQRLHQRQLPQFINGVDMSDMNPNEIYDFFTNLDLEANKKPVSQNLVESLPDTQVTNLAQTQRQGAASSDSKEENKCLVCMCEYEEGDMVKTLPCFHKYHKECIAEWFKRQNFCPFCRSEVK